MSNVQCTNVWPPSSRGLGHELFKLGTPVRIRLGALLCSLMKGPERSRGPSSNLVGGTEQGTSLKLEVRTEKIAELKLQRLPNPEGRPARSDRRESRGQGPSSPARLLHLLAGISSVIGITAWHYLLNDRDRAHIGELLRAVGAK